MNLKKPLKILRILIPSYIKSRIKPIPLWTHIYFTRKCNLNCEYCYVRDPLKKEMSTNKLKQVIDKVYSLGCRFIAIYGGEPTLRKDLSELIEYMNKKGIITYLCTNGTLLTPNYIEKIAKAGIDAIEISIDSVLEFKESKKDFFRLKRVLIDLLDARKKFGFILTVVFVMTNKNIDTVEATIKKIASLNIPIAISIISRNTITGEQSNPELFFNTKKDKEKLFQTLDKIKKMKKKYHIIGPKSYFEELKDFLTDKNFDWYCCAGKYYFAVDSDGKFMICSGLEAEKESIFEIDKNYYKKFEKIRRQKLAKCKKLCFANCYYSTSSFMKNPFSFLKELL